MKLFPLITILTVFSFGAQAQMREGLGVSTGVTLAPFVAPTLVVQCARKGEFGTCLPAITFGATALATYAVVLGVVLKEEIKNVQPDALNYLAGGPMTYALEDVILKLKSKDERIEALSEEEMVVGILEMNEIL